jgi:Cu2+-exporting ATPase
MRCAGCARTIERAITAIPGIQSAHVNVATARVSAEWRSAEANLKLIVDAVSAAGFKPTALTGETAERQHRDDRRLALKRIGLAGLGSMQVMMYVFGLYVAEPADIDPAMASFLRYTGMLITTPILIYCGAPFFSAAWRNVRQRTLGMDVPVALALILAYGASVYNTLRATGQTYFDSVAMFIFFLSVGRYIEMTVRRRSLSTNEALGRSLPSTVIRIKADGTTERVPLREIAAGDRLSIPRGAVIPIDAVLVHGSAWVDESLMTGEAAAVRRAAGDRLLGGAVNAGDAVQIVAERTVQSSTLASIVALLERAQSNRPRLTLAADRAASWFVGTVLVLAVLVAGAWCFIDSTRAFAAALAVLVVTCPCALSLATPVATAAATLRLAQLGVLVTRPDTLERLAQVDTVVLDKTGTLTASATRIQKVTLLGTLDHDAALAIAAALERRGGPSARTSIHAVCRTGGSSQRDARAGRIWRRRRSEWRHLEARALALRGGAFRQHAPGA